LLCIDCIAMYWFYSFYNNIIRLRTNFTPKTPSRTQPQAYICKREYFISCWIKRSIFIKLYFRILNYDQSISWILLLILVIALQLHKQLAFLSNRWQYCTHYSTEFNTLVYYLNISIKIYLSLQGNSTKTHKDKATRGKQPLHLFKISIYSWLNTKTSKITMHSWLNTKIIKISMSG
jgi:hypothetical protein